MARRLEGKKFAEWYNNGVTAIVSEEVLFDRERMATIRASLENFAREKGLVVPDLFSLAIEEGLKHFTQVPIFTFVPSARLEHQPCFTGDMVAYCALAKFIVMEGGSIVENMFYVPFSNACETGAHGVSAMRDELKYVTTDEQFRETFGIGLREVEEVSYKMILERDSKV